MGPGLRWTAYYCDDPPVNALKHACYRPKITCYRAEQERLFMLIKSLKRQEECQGQRLPPTKSSLLPPKNVKNSLFSGKALSAVAAATAARRSPPGPARSAPCRRNGAGR